MCSEDQYVCLQHLWVMVVQEADLTGQLRVMKDFFLLGRGELFLAFIDQAQHLLKGPPAPSTEHGQYNLPAPLLQAQSRISGTSLLQAQSMVGIPSFWFGCGELYVVSISRYSICWMDPSHPKQRDGTTWCICLCKDICEHIV